jgi:SAM-dependent methyltransferase
MAGADPTTRFSDRVADYVRYRPAYPNSLLTALREEIGIAPGMAVADVGSGTGISSELLLRTGCDVFAVEPNREMRVAAETRLGNEPRFHSVAGRAEATTLEDSSVDAVAAGQAFHWFSTRDARTEFIRILRPGGITALFWNTRRAEGSPFLSAYEHLIRVFGTDYSRVDHRNVDASALRAFFGGPYQSRVYANAQIFDFDGLRGRLLSSSYVPGPEHRNYRPILDALRQLFDTHEENGCVRMEYDTELFFGRFV